MPTAASCAAATRAVPAKPTNTAPRTPVSVTTLPVGQAPSVTPLSRGPNATTIPTTSLVLVNSTTPGVPMGNKVVSATHVGGAPQASHPGATQVKYIDLTMEDDAGGAKQAGKQVGLTRWSLLVHVNRRCVHVHERFGKCAEPHFLCVLVLY